MFKKLWNIFSNKTKFYVVEVEQATKLPELTQELRESIKTLEFHPGFRYLTAKLRYERAMLEKYLHEGFTLAEGQMHHLQGGIHYLKYLESEIARHVKAQAAHVRQAAQHEDQLFQQFYADSIETIDQA